MPDSPAPTSSELADRIRLIAADEGFIACGFAPAVTSDGFSDLVQWIDNGYAADMNYFANRIDAYRHPEGVLPGARTVVVLAFPYARTHPQEEVDNTPSASQPRSQPRTGRVARYTWQGTDYHDVIHPKLKRICRLITAARPDARPRGVVDTAPLMEREVATLAGLGWRGKNTLLLNRSLGSYFFLACVLVDIELPADSPHLSDHCGTCTACLDACPTDAFVSPNVLDASRCISYLTIESREMIPVSLRDGVGDWLFGCDVCQEVCPWNQKPTRAAMAREAMAQEAMALKEMASDLDEKNEWLLSPDSPRGRLELGELFRLDEEQFRERFRRSPMWRTRRRGLLRNAAIVLGNIGDVDSLESLVVALRDDESIVRASAVWAIRKIIKRHPDHRDFENAIQELTRLSLQENDPVVRAELDPE